MQRAAVVVAIFALLAAACGGGGGSSAPAPATEPTSTTPTSSAQQAVLQAGSKTQSAESARISFTATIKGGAASGTMTGEGEFSGRQGRISMDMSGLGGEDSESDDSAEAAPPQQTLPRCRGLRGVAERAAGLCQ